MSWVTGYLIQPSACDPGHTGVEVMRSRVMKPFDANSTRFKLATKIALTLVPMLILAAAPSLGAPFFAAPYLRVGTGFLPNDLAIRDIDGDGHGDMIVTGSDQGFQYGSVSVLRGVGDGTFGPRVEYPAGARGRFGLALADFTGDERLDVA